MKFLFVILLSSYFYLMNINLLFSSIFVIEIIVVLTWIFGFFVIANSNMLIKRKFIWLLVIAIFNLIGLMAYYIKGIKS